MRWVAAQPLAQVRDAMKQSLSLVATGQLSPPAVTVYPLTSVEEALRDTERSGQGREALLHFSGSN